MSRKTDAIKRACVALGFGSAVSEYTGQSVVDVLKELAVQAECAPTVADIKATGVVGILNFIADNKGSEEHEPYDLSITQTHATVTVKRNGKTISAATDILYNGDKLTIEAEAAGGYELTTLAVNGTDIESGDVFTVNGHNVAIVATGEIKTFDLTVENTDCTVAVTKGGEAVSPAEDALTYGDEIVITASVAEGYELTSLKVNGEDFVSGESLAVNDDVAIVATGTAQG